MTTLSEKVRLIAAAPDMDDPNFKNALVLVIENHLEGAFGFVLNKEADVFVNELFTSEPSKVGGYSAFSGGPVDPARPFLMTHREVFNKLDFNVPQADDILSFSKNIKVLSDPDQIEEYIAKFNAHTKLMQSSQNLDHDQEVRHVMGASAATGLQKTPFPYKVILGYSGWEVDQLENELHDGLWIEIPFDESLAFSPSIFSLWKEALARIGLNSIESYQVPDSDWLN